MNQLFLSLLFGLLCLTPASAWAADEAPNDPQGFAAGILATYRGLGSLAFDFTQRTRTGPGRSRDGAGNGTLYRTSDDQHVIRWDYFEPEEQVLVNNGLSLRIYTPASRQMIVTSTEDMKADVLYGLFTGGRELGEEFTASVPDEDARGLDLDPTLRGVKLAPRNPQEQFQSVHLWFGKDFIIQAMSLRDHFDTITELRFGKIRVNHLPSDDAATLERLNTIELVEGTEIITR